MIEIEKLSGLIAAPHTAFDHRGEINYAVIEKQVNVLLAQGISGAYVSGTTGEGISCSVAERLRIMDEWHRAAAGRLKLIIHIGALSIRDVETLGRHADALGVFGTSVVPANYFKPADLDTLIEFCRVAATSAPHTAFYYYHTGMSGINFSMVEFLKSADGVIPNLAGIKFNSPDLYEYQNCRHVLNGKYDIVYGVDEFFAGALALGAKCLIGSTYNYAAALYWRIWQDFNACDHAAVENGMRKVCRIVDLLVRHGGVAAGKAMMLIHDIDCGDTRLPLKSLPLDVKKQLAEQVKAILQSE